MTMATFRLPSGVYMNMVAVAAADEAHFISEYPTFHNPRGLGRGHGPADGSWGPTTVHARYKDGHLDHKAPFMSTTPVYRGSHQPESQAPQPEVCLPLVSVSIDMQVDCNIAKTKLVQTFTNHGSVSIPEAWYSFPLYDGATVTSFRCEVGEDKVLEGKVKPKGEAKDEFKRALKKQEAAALIEELTPDVFQTSIGNIKPRSTIRVEITYVEELHNDLSGDGILVTIPTSVAPRYGTPPAGYRTNSAVKNTGLSLVVSVMTPGPTKEIVCRSGHGIFIEYGKMIHTPEAASFEALAEVPNQEDSQLSPKHATIHLSHNQAVMDRDFVLFIPSSGDGLLKSQALLAPSNGSNHAAMMVTVSPNELFSDLQESMDEFDGEILFLADRSGSMTGPKLRGLKDALLVFLKSLPAKCKFNIYSFGSQVTSMWPRSMPYNESTMRQALDHISTFSANFGGTEVLNALRKAVGDRMSTESSSTQLILLTDGEIWQADKTIDFVRMTTSDADGQVRFFSLGIGNLVSHQLIQGIGFFGGGFGQAVAVDAHGRWKEAVVHMLKGAVMPNSWSYSIQFGDEWNEKRLDLDDLLPYRAERSPPEALRQLAGAADRSFIRAPRIIPFLHHFGQQSVYFLLDSTSDHLPEYVTITASSQYGGTKTATLAVTKSTSINIMQHLAAKAAVRDLETQDTAEASSNRIRKNAEYLCQTYSITSKWASFVAVSHLQPSAEYEDFEVSLYKAPLAELDLMIQPEFSLAGANRPAPSRPRIEECMASYYGRDNMSDPQDRYVSRFGWTSSSPSTNSSYCAPSSAGFESLTACFDPSIHGQTPFQPDAPAFNLGHLGTRRKESYNENFGRRKSNGDGRAVIPYGEIHVGSRTILKGEDDVYSSDANDNPANSQEKDPNFRVRDPSTLLSKLPVPRDETEERSRREQDLDDSDDLSSALPHPSIPLPGIEEAVEVPGEILPRGQSMRRGTVDTTASSREPSPPSSVNAFALARRPAALSFSEQRPDNAQLKRTMPITSRHSHRSASSVFRPNDTAGLMAPNEQLKAKEESDKEKETFADEDAWNMCIDPDNCLMQTLNCPYTPPSDYNNLHQLGSGVREIDWLELIRCQRADGLFDLEESLGNLMAQHFCHGTQQALRHWIVKRMKRSIAGAAVGSRTTDLLVDTVMALAYLRSHLYSKRALWELLVRKAERRLALHFKPEQWDGPDGVSAIADSALVHAHYARCSQGTDGDSSLESNPSHGRCAVCDSQDGKPLSSAQHDGRPAKCSFPDCDVLLGDGDEFWAHTFEQDHILSSCEKARDRYREAAAKAGEAEACREG